MDIDVSFHITVQVPQGKFRMLVHHYYSSDKVERFKVDGKGRYLKLEKQLDQKHADNKGWKIIAGALVSDLSSRQAAQGLTAVMYAIDKYLDQRDKSVTSGYIYPNKTKRS